MALEDLEQARGNSGGVDRLLSDAARASRYARERLDTATVDLFLSDDGRLRDVERVTTSHLLAKLIAAIEDEFRLRLLDKLGEAGALHEEPVAAALLDRARVLRDRELVAMLLRRTEEYRLAGALRQAAARDPDSPPPLLDRLLRSDDPALSTGAMALLIADSRRFDRFQDPLIAFTDLPAELHHRLVWWVAAALRIPLISAQRASPSEIDQALASAALATLGGYDEGETLEGRAMLLARGLREAGRLDDATILHALGDGQVTLAVAGLALRAGIEFGAAWDMATDGYSSRLILLLRAADMERATAADFALRLVPDGEAVAERIGAFDGLSEAQARDALRLWRLDGAYRRAIDEIVAGLEAERGDA